MKKTCQVSTTTTAAVIDADGNYLGKYRKHHIPHCGRASTKVLLQAGLSWLSGIETRMAKSVSTFAMIATSEGCSASA